MAGFKRPGQRRVIALGDEINFGNITPCFPGFGRWRGPSGRLSL